MDWNRTSGVTACTTCDGHGSIPSMRKATLDDPYPETPCPDCDGPHIPECPVCGFSQAITGYDCLACETIASLTDADASSLDVDEFTQAIRATLAARRQSHG